MLNKDNKPSSLIGLFALLRKSFGDYKIKMAVLALLSFLSSTLEGIGITAIIPLFSFISKDQPASIDFISRFIGKVFAILHFEYALSSLLIFVISLFVIKSVALFFANYMAGVITSKYETRTRNELLAAALNADWSYLSRQKLGHLDQILTTNIDNSAKLLSYISYTILVMANLVIYSLLVVNISVAVALMAVVSGVVLLLALKPLFYKNTVVAEKQVSLYKTLAHYINENIIRMKTIKSPFVQERVKDKSRRYFEDMRSLNM